MTNRAPTGTDHRALAALARDAALARIGRARAAMLIGAVVLTALLAALASALLPGKSLGASHKAATTETTPARSAGPGSRPHASATPGMPAPAGPAALGLEGPSQAPTAVAPSPTTPPPQPTPAPAPAAPSGGGTVVSGGS
jgi:hypothetical protein